jgi:hypothetical protein
MGSEMAMARTKLVIRAGLALFGALAACSAIVPTSDCADDLRLLPVPGDTTVAVGQQFTARLQLSTCGGRRQISDALEWSTLDSSVVKVDRKTGVVTGVTAGRTRLMATSATYGSLPAGYVTVR